MHLLKKEQQEAIEGNSHLMKKEQQKAIEHLLPPNRDVWIGLSDIGVEDSWEWSDGEPLTYANWGANSPNENWAPNRAVRMWSGIEGGNTGKWHGDWGAYDDTKPLRYVCAQRATPGAQPIGFCSTVGLLISPPAQRRRAAARWTAASAAAG